MRIVIDPHQDAEIRERVDTLGAREVWVHPPGGCRDRCGPVDLQHPAHGLACVAQPTGHQCVTPVMQVVTAYSTFTTVPTDADSPGLVCADVAMSSTGVVVIMARTSAKPRAAAGGHGRCLALPPAD